MKLFQFTASIGIVLFVTLSSLAHPLGNFSVNQYSGIEADGGKILITQVLDLAEIPTLQQTPQIDTDKDGQISETEISEFARCYVGSVSVRTFAKSRRGELAVRAVENVGRSS